LAERSDGSSASGLRRRLGLAATLAAVLCGGPGLAFAAPAPPDRLDHVAPPLPADLRRPAVLIFTKTNGYRHDSIPAATAALTAAARRQGLSAFATANGAVFNDRQLARFDAVIWANTSGTTLTEDQEAAFRRYIEGGGGFMGVHGAGGDPAYAWPWYVQTLIGAQFIGHPGPPFVPQFQPARLRIEDHAHPATAGLGRVWRRTDEWYSFSASPRGRVHVLVSLDEASYRPVSYDGKDIHMGDHPLVWWRCVGKGRAFFTAMGHLPEAYSEPDYLRLLGGAMAWSAGLKGPRC
jgi:type 1 glutamine amidotransferase